MWYFAYGSNLNAEAVADWCRHHQERVVTLRDARPAILEHYRLCFAVYSDYWGGGIADVVYDPGKSVAGALFDLSEADLAVLDRKVGRKLDENGNEAGIYRRVDVTVKPVGKGKPVTAVTYQGTETDRRHIPPTQHYMELLLQGAYQIGLSMMWISYLKSFSTHAGRKPRPPRR